MSRRRYPRVVVSFRDGSPRIVCEACGKPRTHRVEMQVNWFRGDDESVSLCDEHASEAEKNAGLLMQKVYAARMAATKAKGE